MQPETGILELCPIYRKDTKFITTGLLTNMSCNINCSKEIEGLFEVMSRVLKKCNLYLRRWKSYTRTVEYCHRQWLWMTTATEPVDTRSACECDSWRYCCC